MDPVARIISLWPSAEHYAADIGLKYPSYARVMKMRRRIPTRYWAVTLAAAEKRGLALTEQDLEAAHARRERLTDQHEGAAA